METIRELTRRHAQDGKVAWIGLRPGRRAAVVAVRTAEVGPNGLVGDHGRPGQRAVTLIQSEHLAAVGAFLGRGPVAPELTRRNVVVSGLNLASMRGSRIGIGNAVIRITGPCAPCSRMEEALGPGGYNAMRGHGGWCAEVIEVGRIAVGDAVRPLESP